MIYAIINQCIILIRILFSKYSCMRPPINGYCWNHSFILAHLFHYKSLDFNMVIECSLHCHYLFRLITKYKIRKAITAKQSSQKYSSCHFCQSLQEYNLLIYSSITQSVKSDSKVKIKLFV